VLFRASVPGPLPDGSNPTPAPVAITAVRFGPEGAEVPITETDRPEVPRCEAPRSRCPTFVFRLATDPPGVLEREGMDFARAAVELRPGAWHASALYEAIAPAESPRCNNDDLGAGGVLRWSAPAAARDVRVLFVLRASDGGFAWARRTVRVR
jgi:hypothetical protein